MSRSNILKDPSSKIFIWLYTKHKLNILSLNLYNKSKLNTKGLKFKKIFGMNEIPLLNVKANDLKESQMGGRESWEQFAAEGITNCSQYVKEEKKRRWVMKVEVKDYTCVATCSGTNVEGVDTFFWRHPMRTKKIQSHYLPHPPQE